MLPVVPAFEVLFLSVLVDALVLLPLFLLFLFVFLFLVFFLALL